MKEKLVSTLNSKSPENAIELAISVGLVVANRATMQNDLSHIRAGYLFNGANYNDITFILINGIIDKLKNTIFIFNEYFLKRKYINCLQRIGLNLP